MHTQFERLMTLLDEEAEFYQKLLACIRNEKRAIIDLDFAKLTAIGGQKENIMMQLRLFAEQRDQALQALSAKMALPHKVLTLKRLSAKAPAPYSEELQRCRSRLRQLLELLGDENNSVKQLVKHGLALVRGSYHLIAQLLDASPVYHSSGHLQPGTETGRFHQGDY